MAQEICQVRHPVGAVTDENDWLMKPAGAEIICGKIIFQPREETLRCKRLRALRAGHRQTPDHSAQKVRSAASP